ncbi:MAG: hypothetical protein FJZ59_07845 [Chlamydiae bacterium]|nr:hypothetical protein [Chlamydiota bacterium]
MTDIEYILKKIIQPKIKLLTDIAIGGVDTFDKYQYIVGQIKSLTDLQQELTNLQKKQELYDEDEEGRNTKASRSTS